ncbi:MAG: prepilin-type N-terminal cleavage/methylation domain-containing protein [Gammaproteobacteria bacterium]|nr:prepilin-type N-terminal cleavage/methylation domain-containing protein [Gammaproteobacteria bacterium]
MRGFTFIEVLTTLVLLSVLAALGMGLITRPAQSFAEQTRRLELVDMADTALKRMARDVRHALPNSVRTASAATRTALEFLHTSGGGRYRAQLEADGSGDPLFNGAADTFDVLGTMLVSSAVDTGPAGQASCFNDLADCLVIYNTGSGPGDFNAYQGDNIATLTAVAPGQLTFDNGGGWSFPFLIPPTAEQRFYIVDTPQSFVCDTSVRELRRYTGYVIGAAQPITDADFGSAGELLAVNVAGCQFTYNPGAGFRHGLVTLRVVVDDLPSGERVALLHQVHVVNVP